MDQFASMLQRGVVDRPEVDKTDLTGNYDFDLEWTYDDTQFGGNLPPIPSQNPGKPDLFAALQQQPGLRLESSKAAIDTIVIDGVQGLQRIDRQLADAVLRKRTGTMDPCSASKLQQRPIRLRK